MSTRRFLRNPPAAFLAAIACVSVSTGQVLPLSVTSQATVYDYISSITAGPDGAMWFTEGLMGRITTDGAISEYSSGAATSVVAGPDGALWFTGRLSNRIGRITTDGLTTLYDLPAPNSDPAGIASGPDGALWFTEAGRYQIGRITTDGQVTEFALPNSGVSPLGIARGPDSAMWFTQCCNQKIGRITPEGIITEYALPSSAGGGRIVAGADALWFTEYDSGKVGRIGIDGAITEYGIPIPGTYPVALAVGTDGSLWFSIASQDYVAGTIGRITTNGTVTFYNAPDDYVAAAAGPDGAMWFASGRCDPMGGCFGSIVRAVPGAGLAVGTLSLPGASIGVPYSACLRVTGGTGPYTWSVIDGSLPSGLALDPATGAISGTPTGIASSFVVRAIDSSMPSQSATRSLLVSMSGVSSLSVAISPSYLGLPINIDGVWHGAEAGAVYTIPCVAGSEHTAGIDTGGLSFAGWDDGILSTSRTVACLDTPTTYTALFTPERPLAARDRLRGGSGR